LLLRADTVQPVVIGDEIAAGIAHQRRLQVPHERHHVAAEAVLVRRLVAGLVDAAIDGPAEMLKEGAVDTVVDRADPEVPVNRNARFHGRPPPYVSSVMIYTR